MHKTLWFAVAMSLQVPSLYCQANPNNTMGLAQQQRNVRDGSYRNAILHKIDSLLESKYVLPEKATEYAEEFKKKYSSGAYESCAIASELAAKVTVDLVAITHDKHITFRVTQASDVGEKVESALHHPVRYYRLRMKEHTGFSRLEWIEGNIGYLDLRRFNSLSEAKELLAAAMRFLSGANAIIIDLRENGGGSGDYLSNYFLPHPTQLTGWYYRDGDYLEEYWTSKDIEGDRMIDVPLFLLTSRRTFSAAESFAYDMKVRKRATLIGDSTKGGAHSVDYYKIDEQFEMYIPTSRAVNPVTNGNWEGVGVIPDVLVSDSSALDMAIVLARSAGEQFSKGREEKFKEAVAEMQYRLDRAETLYREKKEHYARVALDSVFQIGNKYGLITEFFINVLAYNYLSKKGELILIAVLKKGIELFPKSPTAYESLAYAYSKIGKLELALEHYRRVEQLNPDDRNAAKNIDRLLRKKEK